MGTVLGALDIAVVSGGRLTLTKVLKYCSDAAHDAGVALALARS